jgi:hypothetical protein
MSQVKLIPPVALTHVSVVGQKTQLRLGGGQRQQRREYRKGMVLPAWKKMNTIDISSSRANEKNL